MKRNLDKMAFDHLYNLVNFKLTTQDDLQIIIRAFTFILSNMDWIKIQKDQNMPLKPGKENIGKNIKEMEKAGHKPSQAIAASLNEARKSGAKIPSKKKK